MFDVITIGSATRDVFVKSNDFRVLESLEFPTGKALAMSLGSKLYIDELNFFVGGGAINAAATFARQGLQTVAFTAVGNDSGGSEIQKFLEKEGISLELVHVDAHDRTSYSIVLTAGKKDRSILRYEGVAWHFAEIPFPAEKLRASKWLYLSHLGGESAKLLPKIFGLAKKSNLSIAWNPGATQIKKIASEVRPYLKYVDVFMVNQEEASLCTKIPYESKEKIFDVLDKWVKGIVVMTRGPEGVEVSEGKTRWSAGVLPLKDVKDRTGAGDAFGSGFVASLMKKPGDIAYAIQFASANATGALTEWGATNGLLEEGADISAWGKLKTKVITS